MAIFDREVGRAAKILKRGPKKDAKGEIVGERAEVMLVKPDEGITAVVWTDGYTFHEIRSSSLQDILELEKQYTYKVLSD